MFAGTGPKVVLITGCSRGGIGFALCEEFAAAGCKVYATARRESAVDGFSHEKIEKLVLDVTDEANRQSVINKVFRESGRLDVLVNNAGVMCPGRPVRGRDRGINLSSCRPNPGCGHRCCPRRVRN